jgi:hypothetical protein
VDDVALRLLGGEAPLAEDVGEVLGERAIGGRFERADLGDLAVGVDGELVGGALALAGVEAAPAGGRQERLAVDDRRLRLAGRQVDVHFVGGGGAAEQGDGEKCGRGSIGHLQRKRGWLG